jgi:hypothetical protein
MLVQGYHIKAAAAAALRNFGRFDRPVHVCKGSSTEILKMSISRPEFPAKADSGAARRQGYAERTV